MTRNKPCCFCKQRRRKCVKISPEAPCELCKQAMRECIQTGYLIKSCSSSSSEEEPPTEKEKIFLEGKKEIQGQVRELENQLYQMEATIKKYGELIPNQREWLIHLVDGRLQLKSSINSLEELFEYGNLAIRYLSPFRKLFKNPILHVKNVIPSYTRSAVVTLGKTQLMIPANQSKAEDDQQSWCSQGHLIRPIQPRHIIPKLVTNYFSCLQSNIPIIHEPSFREHFELLKDPLDDPITVAICAVSSLSTCEHSFLNNHEKRHIGEYFYRLSMEKLLDIYDDTSRATEVLITINCVQQFNLVTLRFDEIRRWKNMADMVARQAYPEVMGYKPREASKLDRLQRIRYAVLSRNMFVVSYFRFMFEFFFEYTSVQMQKFDIYFDILPDESDKSRNYIEAMNYLLRLNIMSPMMEAVSQMYCIAAGDATEISIELVLRYGQLISEWWRKIPDRYKVCDDIFDVTEEDIKNTTDPLKLNITLFSTEHLLMVYGYMTQFVPSNEAGNCYDAIRNKLVTTAIKMTDAILLILEKNKSTGTQCNMTRSFLYLCDPLITLSQLKDIGSEAAYMIRERLSACLDSWKRHTASDCYFMSGFSPYSIVSIATPTELPPATEMYKQYPLPLEAMLFDIIQTAVRNLDGNSILNPIT